MLKTIFTIFMVLATALSNGQNLNRTFTAIRTTEKPKIDGKPFEKIWDSANNGSEFKILRPENGLLENEKQRSVIKILYDDNALYIAAFLFDSQADQISAQFSKRDETNVQADLFSFWINTYNNQIEQTRFYISAAGSVADSKAINGDEDFSYNVIFDAKSSKDKNGWYVEMEIPYQALRFPKSDIQNWSFNALRKVNRLNQTMTYNYINIEQGNEAQYDALLLGIEKIKPPIRLSLFPYSSIQHKRFANQSKTEYNVGLDLKFGLSDAFTFDATLIPDFGQVAFDEVELNLSPFEQVFEERRPFFTEGTELFNKGDIFFSRRIGQLPLKYNEVGATLGINEIVENNPLQSQLLNAIKFSGRTKSKFGIGLLNALTKETNASIIDTLNKVDRKFTTNPLTNYNLIVLDKQYGANSSFYFSNANTIRFGDFTDANVSAIGINHFNKANKFNYKGDYNISNRFQDNELKTGYSFRTRWQKVEGKWRYGISYNYVSKTYNPNDLGLQFQNNLNSTFIFGSYNQFKPKGWFNNYTINYNIFHSRTNSPNTHNFTQFSINPSFQTKKLWQGGAFITAFTREFDFFESRIAFTPILYQPKLVYGLYLTSDSRKKLSAFLNVNSENRFNDPENRMDLRLRLSFRITDKFFFQYQLFLQGRNNRLSYVTLANNESIFSLRDTKTIENTIEAVYNFDQNKALNLKIRNFWSSADFTNKYRRLGFYGRTTEYTASNNFNPNADFNVWNLDCNYEWQFAPASSLILLYRNTLSSIKNAGKIGFFESTNQLFQNPLDHTLSLRLVYFFDVNKVRKGN